MSSASWAGVFPAATMSLINGVVIMPSGRTWILVLSSGLRQTKTFSWSSGPMTYFSAPTSSLLTKVAGGKVWPERALAQPETARAPAPMASAKPKLVNRRMVVPLRIGRSLLATHLGRGSRRFGRPMGRRGKITVRNKPASAAVPFWDRPRAKVNSRILQEFREREEGRERSGDWPRGRRRRQGRRRRGR